jgi:hypothetical protein
VAPRELFLLRALCASASLRFKKEISTASLRLRMTALLSLGAAWRPPALWGKMTASFREMGAISGIFPSENPSESEPIRLNRTKSKSICLF